jgi:magnesium-transporting ATPase (P-type)
MAIGASNMATKHHAIVTRTSALQDIASMEVLCSDKTGTITTAKVHFFLGNAGPVVDNSCRFSTFSSLCCVRPKKIYTQNNCLIVLLDEHQHEKGFLLERHDRAT